MKSIKEIAIIKNNARLLLSIKEQIDILKAEEKKLTDSLKAYMLEEKLISHDKEKKPFESFLLIEKKNEELLASELYKHVDIETFILCTKVIKSEAEKAIGKNKVKELSIEGNPTYTLKRA